MVREFVFLGLSEFRIRDYGLGFGVIDFLKKKTYSTIDIAMNNLTILMLRLDGWLECIVRLVE